MKFGLTQYTLDHFFNSVLEQFAERPALALVGDEPFTYKDFGHRVAELKSTLRSMGIKKQDNIAILGQSSPHWATAYMAITTFGAVAVPILEEFPPDDIEHILRHADIKAVFISKSHYDRLSFEGLRNINIIFQLDDFSVLLDDGSAATRLWKPLHELPKILKGPDRAGTTAEQIDEEDLAEILYTSGTTGHSKGVMLTHKNIVSNIFEGPDLLKVIISINIKQSVPKFIIRLNILLSLTSKLIS
jgi:long-chain acyl-CoA synthetase